MKRRKGIGAVLSSSPTAIGAVTTLIVIVAVFLAYNANSGLPFVPVYKVSVLVPNASRLVVGNEVRIGGSRVGAVDSIEALRRSGGSSDDAEGGGPAGAPPSGAAPDESGGAIARLGLKLDESAGPIPQDSIFRIRYRSTFGLKYLEVTRGSGPAAPEGFTFDGTNDTDDPDDSDDEILSIREASLNQTAGDGTFVAQTEFDEVGNTFDQPTRNAIRRNLVGYGDGFTGRGISLNEAIQALKPLFTSLEPVAATLADRRTQLRRLFPALARTAAIVAPVARENAELFGNLARTLAAIGADPGALQDTIAGAPPALQAGIETLPAQRPFLADTTELLARLRPGVRELDAALPALNAALAVGTPSLRRSVAASDRLRGVFGELDRLVSQPETKSSLRRLDALFEEAGPLARWVVPAQTVCNYWNYFWTLLPEHLTERDSSGFTQRVTLVTSPLGNLTFNLDLDAGGPAPPVTTTIPGEVETGLSTAGYSGVQANGKYGLAAPPPHSPGQFDPHELPILHANAAGPTGQNGSDCQAGQTGYLLGRLPVKGQSRRNPAITVPDLPGDRGITDVYFTRDGGRELRDTRVPARQP